MKWSEVGEIPAGLTHVDFCANAEGARWNSNELLHRHKRPHLAAGRRIDGEITQVAELHFGADRPLPSTQNPCPFNRRSNENHQYRNHEESSDRGVETIVENHSSRGFDGLNTGRKIPGRDEAFEHSGM